MIINKCSRCDAEHPVPRANRNDGICYCGCGGTVEPFAVCPLCDAEISLSTAEKYGYPLNCTDYLCPSCYEQNQEELDAIDELPLGEAAVARRNWLYATA